jgi:hypothetical protein
VPLADQRGLVPGVADQGRQGRVSDRDAVDGVGHADRLRQAARQTAGIAARVETEPGRRAHRGRRVGLCEPHPRRGQPIQVRCPDLRRAEAGQVGPAEIVGEDDEQVRPARPPTTARLERLLDRRVGRHPTGRQRGKSTGPRRADEPAPADAAHRASLPHATITTSTPKLRPISTMRHSVPPGGKGVDGAGRHRHRLAGRGAAPRGRRPLAGSPRTLTPNPDTGRTMMSKRTSKRKARKRKSANHGKRPNGN